MKTDGAMTPAIPLPRYGKLGGVIGKIEYRCRKWLGQTADDRYALEKIDCHSILVLPSVFNPHLMRSGRFFAEHLSARALAGARSVLDMGTGSGICAIACARHVPHVVAVDINPAAARCARINAMINRVESRVEVREGDLFGPVNQQRFDVVLFNPPFFRGAPKDARDCAWRSTDAIDRFAAQLTDHLSPNGFALLQLSTFGDAAGFLELFVPGWSVELWAQRDFVNETLAIFKLTRKTRSTDPNV